MKFFVILAICAMFGLVASQSSPNHDKAVLCNVFTKSLYDSENKAFDIEKFDLTLCTHLIVIDKYWKKSEDPWETEDPHRDSDYSQLTGLRNKYPHLKVLLGLNREVGVYVTIGKNATHRQAYIKTAVEFVSNYKMDGIDLTWAYQFGDILPPYSDIIVLFVKEFKEKLALSDRLLTSTFHIGVSSQIDDYNFSSLSKSCDLMTFWHTYSYVTGVESALRIRNISAIEYYVNGLLKRGVPSNKMLIFLPSISPKFITTPSNVNSNKYDGDVNYNVICDLLLNQIGQNWQKSFNNEADLAIAQSHNGTTNIRREIVFETSRSMANKVRFVLKHQLAGVMTNALHHDDTEGKCGFEPDTWEDFKNSKVTFHIPKRNIAQFPLVRTINEAIEVVLDEIRQDPSHSTRSSVSAIVLITGILAFLMF